MYIYFKYFKNDSTVKVGKVRTTAAQIRHLASALNRSNHFPPGDMPFMNIFRGVTAPVYSISVTNLDEQHLGEKHGRLFSVLKYSVVRLE